MSTRIVLLGEKQSKKENQEEKVEKRSGDFGRKFSSGAVLF